MCSLSKNEFHRDVNIGGFIKQSELAAKYITNNECGFYYADVIYSQFALTRTLRQGYPVLVGREVYWNDNYKRTGGHATVIYGFYYNNSGMLYLRVQDPWSPNIGSTYSISYSTLMKETGLTTEGVSPTRYWDGITVQSNSYQSNTIGWSW